MSKRKGKIHDKRRAREGAITLLYSSDIVECEVDRVIENGFYPSEGAVVTERAEKLAAGVEEHLADIDKRLASTSENWALDRMPMLDRAILRLAVYEMVYVDDVPISVAINEAVELAKAFGGEDDSSRFVNGVLGRIARSLEEEQSRGSEEEQPSDESAAQASEAQQDAAPEAQADTGAADDEGEQAPDAPTGQ